MDFARVLVPFGLIPERAADDCWAEALRLVLASSNTGASPEDRNGSRAAAGDDETIVEGRASGRKRLTLPGGLWDEVGTVSLSRRVDVANSRGPLIRHWKFF